MSWLGDMSESGEMTLIITLVKCHLCLKFIYTAIISKRVHLYLWGNDTGDYFTRWTENVTCNEKCQESIMFLECFCTVKVKKHKKWTLSRNDSIKYYRQTFVFLIFWWWNCINWFIWVTKVYCIVCENTEESGPPKVSSIQQPLTAGCRSCSVIWWWRWASNKGGHRQFSSHHFCLSVCQAKPPGSSLQLNGTVSNQQQCTRKRDRYTGHAHRNTCTSTHTHKRVHAQTLDRRAELSTWKHRQSSSKRNRR